MVILVYAVLMFPATGLAIEEQEDHSLFKQDQRTFGGGIGMGVGLTGAYFFSRHVSLQGDLAPALPAFVYSDLLMIYHSAWNEHFGWYGGLGLCGFYVGGAGSSSGGTLIMPWFSFGLDIRFNDALYATVGLPYIGLNYTF